jgi:hypothetical protein
MINKNKEDNDNNLLLLINKRQRNKVKEEWKKVKIFSSYHIK